MNLNDYFDPVGLEIDSQEIDPINQLLSSVKIHTPTQKISAVQDAEIAIIGVSNYNEQTNNRSLKGLRNIRTCFYQLANFSKKVKLYDLGNIKQGKTIEDSSAALRDVIAELFTLDIIPIILGDSENVLYPNYLGYKKIHKEINLVSIDSRINISENRAKKHKSALWKILIENNESLFSYINLGYQTHFVSPKLVNFLSENLHDIYRLGNVRSKLKEVEPLFRDADLIGLSIASVRQSDAFGQKKPSPNGFYGEEICRLARYAGMSTKLTSFGIYDYDSSYDINNQSAHLIAQIIWYFVDGFINRYKEYPLEAEGDYKKFIVSLDNLDHEMIFYKSEKTNRWWVEVPSLKKNRSKRVLISCNYDDYLEAGNGDIPERWLKAFQKLN